MGKIHNPHDKFFKEVFGNVNIVQDFIKHYVPIDIQDTIDLTTVMPQKESFVTPYLEEYFSDLLFRVNMRSNEEGYLYFYLNIKAIK